MKTAKDLELLLLVKEHEKQKLQLRIKQAINLINEFAYEVIENKDGIDFYISRFDLVPDLLDILEGEKNVKN